MKTVGLFEAKTRLSELCREVAETGEAILIERRGEPIAQLSPPQTTKRKRPNILADIASFEAKQGKPDWDFPEVWQERSLPRSSPLED